MSDNFAILDRFRYQPKAGAKFSPELYPRLNCVIRFGNGHLIPRIENGTEMELEVCRENGNRDGLAEIGERKGGDSNPRTV